MKTTADIDKEINTLVGDYYKNSGTWYENERKRIKGEIEFLRTIRIYISQDPDPYYIKKELTSIEEKIKTLRTRWSEWAGTNSHLHRDPKAAFNKAMGIPQLQEQAKALKYIID